MFILRNYLPEITVRVAAELLRDYKGRVADIACGKGPLLKELSPLNGKRIFGVDQAWDQITDADASGMSVAAGNILMMPFKSGIFDTAICFQHFYQLFRDYAGGVLPDKAFPVVRRARKIILKNPVMP